MVGTGSLKRDGKRVYEYKRAYEGTRPMVSAIGHD